jgi:hypothetical protein
MLSSKALPYHLVHAEMPGMLDFELPPELEASKPPETRGLARGEDV